ncbi:MAG: CPBP family intramembrane glutamic endopeptidase [Thermoanaerobaculales bacterium]
MTESRRRAIAALFLLAPVPSIGVWAAMVGSPGPFGHAVFLGAKLWLLVFPAAWWFVVEKGRPSWWPLRRGENEARLERQILPADGLRRRGPGYWVGALSGLAFGAIIIFGSLLVGVQRIDLGPLHNAVRDMGLATPAAFLAGALGWTLVNSLVEEYVYRWFILRQCDTLLSKWPAIVAQSSIFTLHHVIAVSRYLSPGFTALASCGVFAGGAVWAWLYFRYRSIWPGWISHVLADVAVFALGWKLLFG